MLPTRYKRQAEGEAADPAEQRAKRAAAEQVRRDRDDMSEDEWQAFTAWREEFGNVDLHISDCGLAPRSD